MDFLLDASILTLIKPVLSSLMLSLFHLKLFGLLELNRLHFSIEGGLVHEALHFQMCRVLIITNVLVFELSEVGPQLLSTMVDTPFQWSLHEFIILILVGGDGLSCSLMLWNLSDGFSLVVYGPLRMVRNTIIILLDIIVLLDRLFVNTLGIGGELLLWYTVVSTINPIYSFRWPINQGLLLGCMVLRVSEDLSIHIITDILVLGVLDAAIRLTNVWSIHNVAALWRSNIVYKLLGIIILTHLLWHLIIYYLLVHEVFGWGES